MLIGEDWTVWRVDFSPAFRITKDLRAPKDLVKCDRQLLEKLKSLRLSEVSEKTKGYLTKDEVNGVFARRDKIVAKFQALIAEKSEKEILYEGAPLVYPVPTGGIVSECCRFGSVECL